MKTTNRIAFAIAFAALGAAAGCAPSAPDKPTWVDDVQPVRMANCVRCHGSPAAGGAPSTFRLDLYEDTIENGQQIRGAATMGRWICIRGSVSADMPPNGSAIPSRARDIFQNWFGANCKGPEAPTVFERGTRAANAEPTITVNTGNGKGDDTLELDYLVSDADRESVTGSLLLGEDSADPACKAAGGRVDLAPLPVHGGAGHVSFDTGTLCAGTYKLSASITDGTPGLTVARQLGNVTIEHPGGNLAPRVELVKPGPDALLNGKVAPITVEFTVHDGDGDYPVTYTVTAVKGEERVDLTPASPSAGTPGQANTVPLNVQVPVDASKLGDSPSWRFEIAVKDARDARRQLLTPYVVVSSIDPASVAIRFNSGGGPEGKGILAVLGGCTDCHGGTLSVPDLDFDPSKPETYAPRLGVLYRKVIQKREMPPKSSKQLIGLAPDDVLSAENRELFRQWLLVGAPMN